MSRKSVLAVALSVVVLLAMLVPAASAAPEWVHGVDITSPTQAKPAYIDPANPAKDGFKVKFDLSIVGTQVDDVDIRIRAIDANNWSVVWDWQYIVASNDLVTGVNKITTLEVFPAWNYGWYRLEVCARDADFGSEWFCDMEPFAVLVDYHDPGVRLIKPAWGSWLTGQEYLLVGKAWDPSWAEDDPFLQYGGIKETWFDYCVISNWQGDWCGPNDESWITIGKGTPSGVVDQYNLVWDTTQVPDDQARVRFCAADFVGRTVCEWAPVQVENRVVLNLHAGWNLISSPLMLYNTDAATVLSHLKDAASNPTWDAIYAMENMNAGEPDVYKWTMLSSMGVGDLSKIVDGKGYWIHMKADDTLTLVGTWLKTGPIAPQEYMVYEGWNLIGYTHWGQPTDQWIMRTAMEYLGGQVSGVTEQMWAYDAWGGSYYPVADSDWLWEGVGYWLALSDGGTINP